MTRQDIITALEAGDYRIEHAEDCCCSFDWDIDGDTITDNCNSNECWEGNVLYVDDEMIAESIRYGESRTLTDLIDGDDIPDEIWDAMRMSDMVQQGDSTNTDTHDRIRRDTLVDWLAWLVTDNGYRLMRDNDRGFANEYTVILVSPDADPDDIGDDWDILTPEQWADDYLYNGDAATEAYNTCLVI
jgi:hypothetical protein